ncbi:MAG: sulfur carrier protein ThiS [Betaproteobacteria bacterium]|nr:sulfur carrier protein ThiS [Betaproteobacteria bacterium]NBY70812.1 sulfur carrier protein ThiS [Betaproteobacteria bacterium]
MTLKVFINRQQHHLPLDATVAQAVAALNPRPPFAVAVNTQFVPKSEYANRLLAPEDEVEIIEPVTGG